MEPNDSIALTPEFSAAQIVTMSNDLVAGGRMTRQAADEALKAEGIEPPAPPAPRTPEQAELEAPGDFTPARPEEYFAPGADMQTREWLATGLWPKDLGSSLVKHMERATQKTKTMAPGERDVWAISERAKLAGIYGDQLDAKLALVGAYINEVEGRNPGFKRFLQDNGALDDALVVTQWVAQAERLAARQRAKRT